MPAERPWVTRLLVDWDAELVRKSILHMYHLARRDPSLVVDPAHDARVWNTLPKL
jgi:N-acyl homoserine lactone hydrolase